MATNGSSGGAPSGAPGGSAAGGGAGGAGRGRGAKKSKKKRTYTRKPRAQAKAAPAKAAPAKAAPAKAAPAKAGTAKAARKAARKAASTKAASAKAASTKAGAAKAGAAEAEAAKASPIQARHAAAGHGKGDRAASTASSSRGGGGGGQAASPAAVEPASDGAERLPIKSSPTLAAGGAGGAASRRAATARTSPSSAPPPVTPQQTSRGDDESGLAGAGADIRARTRGDERVALTPTQVPAARHQWPIRTPATPESRRSQPAAASSRRSDQTSGDARRATGSGGLDRQWHKVSAEEFTEELEKAKAFLRRRDGFVTGAALHQVMSEEIPYRQRSGGAVRVWRAQSQLCRATEGIIDGMIAVHAVLRIADIRAALSRLSTIDSVDELESVYGPLVANQRVKREFDLAKEVVTAGKEPVDIELGDLWNHIIEDVKDYDKLYDFEDSEKPKWDAKACLDALASKVGVPSSRYLGIRVAGGVAAFLSRKLSVVQMQRKMDGHVFRNVRRRLLDEKRSSGRHALESAAALLNVVRSLAAAEAGDKTEGLFLLVGQLQNEIRKRRGTGDISDEFFLTDILLPLAVVAARGVPARDATLDDVLPRLLGDRLAVATEVCGCAQRLDASSECDIVDIWLQLEDAFFSAVNADAATCPATLAEFAREDDDLRRLVHMHILRAAGASDVQGALPQPPMLARDASTDSQTANADAADLIFLALHDYTKSMSGRVGGLRGMFELLLHLDERMTEGIGPSRRQALPPMAVVKLLLDEPERLAEVAGGALGMSNGGDDETHVSRSDPHRHATLASQVWRSAVAAGLVDDSVGGDSPAFEAARESIMWHMPRQLTRGAASVDEVVKRAKDSASQQRLDSEIPTAASVVVGSTASVHSVATALLTSTTVDDPSIKAAVRDLSGDAGSDVPIFVALALWQINACVPLESIATATSWMVRFAPIVGSLEQFLRAVQHAKGSQERAGRVLLAALDEGAADEAVVEVSATLCSTLEDQMSRFNVLEIESGVFVNLAPDHIMKEPVSSFGKALHDDYGKTAASIVVTDAVTSLHISRSMVALFAAETSRFFEDAVDVSEALWTAIEALSAVPTAMLPSVGHAVFIEPMASIGDWRQVCVRLVRERRSVVQDRVRIETALSVIGVCKGISEWTALGASEPARAGDSAADTVAGDASVSDGISDRPQVPVIVDTAADTPSAASLSAATSSESHDLAVVGGAPRFVSRKLEDESEPRTAEECTEVFKDIHIQFGVDIGDGHDAERSKPSTLVRNIAQNGVQQLSVELYSAASHFLLEVIQNADDNTYPEEEVAPSLEITLTDDNLTFYNNEVGFRKKNVVALSALGQSTKKKGDAGYIGHKGIGWKSVFKVSNKPRVHSGPWHFSYDANDPDFRFLLPRQIDAPRDWKSDQTGTLIELPLTEAPEVTSNKRALSHMVRDMRLRLADIRPRLLLFLRRLHRIRIADRSREMGDAAETHEMMRWVDDDGAVCLKHAKYVGDVPKSQHQERWWMQQLQVEVPPSVRRDGMTQTTISIALLDIVDRSQIHDCEVYAFLPLRDYGFKFILQADFVIPATREDVDGASSWNVFIRSQVPKLFGLAAQSQLDRAHALAGAEKLAARAESGATERSDGASESKGVEYSDSESHSSSDESDVSSGEDDTASDHGPLYHHAIDVVNNLLAVVPVPGTSRDFFAGVGDEVCKVVKALHLIPTTNPESSTLEFRLPSRVVLYPHSSMFNGVRSSSEQMALTSILARCLGQLDFRFPSNGVEVPASVGKALGMRNLANDAGLVLQCIEVGCRVSDISDAMKQKWLAWMLHVLHNTRSSEAVLDRLRTLPFVRVRDGDWVAPRGEGGVQTLYVISGLTDASINSVLGGITQHVRVVEDKFVEACRRHKVDRWLKAAAELRPLKGLSFALDVIVPLLATAKVSNEDLIALLRVAVHQGVTQSGGTAEIDMLASKMCDVRARVVLDDGSSITCPLQGVHLWRGCRADPFSAIADKLEALVSGTVAASGLQSPPWPMLSGEYVSGTRDGAALIELFLAAGCKHAFKICEVNVTVSAAPSGSAGHLEFTDDSHSTLPGTTATAVLEAMQGARSDETGTSRCRVIDYRCEELEQLIEVLAAASASDDRETRGTASDVSKVLVKGLADLPHLREASQAQLLLEDSEAKLTVPSSLLRIMTDSKWLPVTNGARVGAADVFPPTDEVKQLLGELANILCNEARGITELLQINDVLSVDRVLLLLEQHARDGHNVDEFGGGRPTILKPRRMLKLYEWMASKAETTDMERPIWLWLPDRKPDNGEKPTAGRFFRNDQCVVDDPSGVMRSDLRDFTNAGQYRAIKSAYGDAGRDFAFHRHCRTLGVPERPRLASSVAIMRASAAAGEHSKESLEAAIRVLISLGYRDTAVPDDDDNEDDAKATGGDHAEQRFLTELAALLNEEPCLPCADGTWKPLSGVSFFTPYSGDKPRLRDFGVVDGTVLGATVIVSHPLLKFMKATKNEKYAGHRLLRPLGLMPLKDSVNIVYSEDSEPGAAAGHTLQLPVANACRHVVGIRAVCVLALAWLNRERKEENLDRFAEVLRNLEFRKSNKLVTNVQISDAQGSVCDSRVKRGTVRAALLGDSIVVDVPLHKRSSEDWQSHVLDCILTADSDSPDALLLEVGRLGGMNGEQARNFASACKSILRRMHDQLANFVEPGGAAAFDEWLEDECQKEDLPFNRERIAEQLGEMAVAKADDTSKAVESGAAATPTDREAGPDTMLRRALDAAKAGHEEPDVGGAGGDGGDPASSTVVDSMLVKSGERLREERLAMKRSDAPVAPAAQNAAPASDYGGGGGAGGFGGGGFGHGGFGGAGPGRLGFDDGGAGGDVSADAGLLPDFDELVTEAGVGAGHGGAAAPAGASVPVADQELGRWGEDHCCAVLRRSFGADSVTWVNEHAETGRPYDIVLRLSPEVARRLGTEAEEGDAAVDIFVEVKTTRRFPDSLVHLSTPEMECAKRAGGRYWMLVLFATREEARLRVLRDVDGALWEGKLPVFMQVSCNGSAALPQ